MPPFLSSFLSPNPVIVTPTPHVYAHLILLIRHLEFLVVHSSATWMVFMKYVYTLTTI